MTDRTLPHLGAITGLQALVLSGTRITDAGVPSLLKLTGLTFLQVYGTRLTRKELRALKGGLPAATIEHD